MRVLGAEARQDHAALVGLAVAVGVGKMQQVGAVDDVHAAIARRQSCRDQQSLGKDGGFVGLAVAVSVFEDDDLVVLLLAWLDLRIRFTARDPETALRIEIDLDRLGKYWIGGKEI